MWRRPKIYRSVFPEHKQGREKHGQYASSYIKQEERDVNVTHVRGTSHKMHLKNTRGTSNGHYFWEHSSAFTVTTLPRSRCLNALAAQKQIKLSTVQNT